MMDISVTDSVNNALTTVKKEPSAAEQKKIRDSSQQFEAILMGQMFEKLQSAMTAVPGGDSDSSDDPGKEQYNGLGIQALAKGLSATGGLGIGKMITKYLLKDQENGGQLQQTLDNRVKELSLQQLRPDMTSSLKVP